MEENKLDQIIGKIDRQIDTIALTVSDTQERLSVIEENMVTKKELENKINSVLTSNDRFVKLHETLDQELVMLRKKYNRLETRVGVLEQKSAATA